MSYMSDNSGSVEVLNNSVLPAMASPVTVSTLVEVNFPDRQFSEITLAEGVPNEGTVRISVANNSGSFTIWPVG